MVFVILTYTSVITSKVKFFKCLLASCINNLCICYLYLLHSFGIFAYSYWLVAVLYKMKLIIFCQ